jgi:hypothetical protein
MAHQTTSTDGSVTITLSDNTSVTFQKIASLSSSNFSDDTWWDGHSGGAHHRWGHSGHPS